MSSSKTGRALVIFLADIDGSESGITTQFDQWARADLIDSTVLTDLKNVNQGLAASVQFADAATMQARPLESVLIAEQWSEVSVVALRAGALDGHRQGRWEDELHYAEMIRERFLGLTVEFATVTIGQIGGAYDPGMFGPEWGIHFLHSNDKILDRAVATLAVRDTDHIGLCLLTASIVAGALRWMDGRALDFKDEFANNEMPLRLVRAQLRVINAGKLLAEVLDGAFPEGGPWTTPQNVDAIQAIAGTPLPNQLIDAVGRIGLFRVDEFSYVRQKRQKKKGFFEGLRFWIKEWIAVVRGTPQRIATQIQGTLEANLERFAQRITYGADSDILLKFRPGHDGLNAQRIVDRLYEDSVPDLAPSVLPNPVPWEVLRSSAFALADGGDFPEGVPAPSQDGQRLLFVDPIDIGPSPSNDPFIISPIERIALGLPEEFQRVEPMGVAEALAVDTALRDRLLVSEIPDYLKDDLDLPPAGTAAAVPANPDTGLKKPDEDGFDATEYQPLTVFYQGNDADLVERYRAVNELRVAETKEHPVAEGNWSAHGRCDFCGTRFHFGVAYVHKPTNKMVHIGHICARKAHLPDPPEDPYRETLLELAARWQRWMHRRRGSFLFQIGGTIETGIDTAMREVAKATEAITSPPPRSPQVNKDSQKKARRWTLRFLGALVLSAFAIAASSLGWFALPFIALGWWILIAISIVGSLLLRALREVRKIVNERFKALDAPTDRATQAERLHHYTKELVRLVRLRQQFDDWQQVIRMIAHVPFGPGNKADGLNNRNLEIDQPYPFAYATSDPSPDQLQQAQLTARQRTIQAGWLSGIFKLMKAAWRQEYERLLLADAREPEADHAPTGTVQARIPGSNAELYSPRADFRERVCTGSLQSGVVAAHTNEIVNWISSHQLDELLSPVEVIGQGTALSGMAPNEFLRRILGPVESIPDFDPDFFNLRADGGLDFRSNNVKVLIPESALESDFQNSEISDWDRTVFFTTFRLSMSPPIRHAYDLSTEPIKKDGGYEDGLDA